MTGHSQDRVVVSVPWSSPWATLPPSADPSVVVRVREVDWQLGRRQRVVHTARQCARLFKESRGARAVVVCTSSADVVGLALLMRLRPRQSLLVYDFLLPRSPLGQRVAKLALRRCNRWLVIRRGDAATLGELMRASDCTFVPFPISGQPAPPAQVQQGLVYAAGTAYRDWQTLVSAWASVPGTLIISTLDAVEVPLELRDRITVVPLMKAEEGRALIARCSAVCLPLVDTRFPSGPLVVLDAMAAGKTVVASDVNGTRDYIRSGETGVLCPPEDAEALAQALCHVLKNASERRRIGDNAAKAAAALSPSHVLQLIVDATQVPPGGVGSTR